MYAKKSEKQKTKSLKIRETNLCIYEESEPSKNLKKKVGKSGENITREIYMDQKSI